jgi:hypothetical protein
MSMIIHSRLDVAEALRRGYPIQPDRHGYVAVTVPDDVDAEARALIAAHLYEHGGRFTIATPTIAPALPEPTVAGLVEVLRAAQAAEEEAARAREAKLAAAIEQARTIIRERRSMVRDIYVGYADGEHIEYKHRYVADVDAYFWSELEPHLSEAERAALAAWREELEADNAARRAAAQARVDAWLAAQRAAEEEAAAERAQWIERHGSSRLKRLVAEKIEHEAVYRDERLAIDRPGWEWEPVPMRLSEPRNPPEAALDLLDAARKTDPAATLAYYAIYRPAEDDEMEEADRHGNVVAERGYVARAEFLGKPIVTTARVTV